jgi:hypothetical protein
VEQCFCAGRFRPDLQRLELAGVRGPGRWPSQGRVGVARRHGCSSGSAVGDWCCGRFGVAVRGTVVLLPAPGGRPAVQSWAGAGVAAVMVMVVEEREVVWPEA